LREEQEFGAIQADAGDAEVARAFDVFRTFGVREDLQFVAVAGARFRTGELREALSFPQRLALPVAELREVLRGRVHHHFAAHAIGRCRLRARIALCEYGLPDPATTARMPWLAMCASSPGAMLSVTRISPTRVASFFSSLLAWRASALCTRAITWSTSSPRLRR